MSSERARLLLAVGLAALAACAPTGGSDELPASVQGVEPPCGDTTRQTQIVLRGSFPALPRVSLDGGAELDTYYRGWVGEFPLKNVQWRDAASLTAWVPAEIPAGIYPLTVEGPFHQRVALPGGFEIRVGGCAGTPGALSLTAVVAPNAVTVGQRVTVTATARNVGTQTLFDVDAAVSSAPAGVALVASETGARMLAGGASTTYAWTYSTTALIASPGATFLLSAAGRDGQGAAVSAPAARTNAFLVSPPANVTAHTSAPASANVGQPFTFTLDVANTGAAPASVSATLVPNVTGGATLTTLSSPTAETVPAGGERSLVWTFSANGPCSVTLSVAVSATDLNSGQGLTVAPTPPSTVTVQRPAALATTVETAPAIVAAGSTVTVTAAVQNGGEATVSNVSPSATAPALFTRLTGPGAPQAILGGASGAFTWTFRAEPGATRGTFAVDAAGLDANTLTTITAPRAVSLEVAVAYPIGGNVSGLGGGTVVLRNGSEDLPVSSDGAFVFVNRVASGATYAVSVATQPAGRTCAVTGGAGIVGSAPVVGVTVTCTRVSRTLTALVDPAGAGTLACDGGACQPTYPDGTVVVISQSPSAGYAFREWAGACTGSAATCTVTMTANRTVTARYDAVMPRLAVATSPTGGGTLACDGSTCQATYAYGTVVSITQTPAAGYTFREWTGDCTGTGPCSVTMTADRAVTAAYDGVTPALVVAASPPGAGTLACDGGTCQATYAYGTVVHVTQTPAAGYTFREWTGDCTGTGPCSVTMTASRSVTANYDAVTPALTVRVSPTEGGTLSCDGGVCQPTYPWGAVVAITQTPSAGYAFLDWSGACTGTASTCTVTMTANRTVTANYDAVTPALAVGVSPAGAGTLECNGGGCKASYAYGTVVVVTQTPRAGYTFREWTGDCTGAGTCSVTLTADRSVTATYDAITPALTVGASPPEGGTLACDGDVCQPTYAYGTVVTITQTPGAGYAFLEWTGDCTGTGNCKVTMTADRAVTAQFVASPSP